MAKTPKTTTAPTGNIAPFGLRMLPELRAKVEESAKESGRSMNAEIVARVESSYKLDDAMELVLDQAQQIKELRNAVMDCNFTMAQAKSVLLGKDQDTGAAVEALDEAIGKTSKTAFSRFEQLINEHFARSGESPERYMAKLKADLEASRSKKSEP